MMGRAGRRLGLGRTNPHAMRQEVRERGSGRLERQHRVRRDAGGWASATTVEETYGHADLHDPAFMAALDRVWGES
jgi:hypothetical protein